MSTAEALVHEVRRALSLAHWADYLELTKPRIVTLVILTVMVGSFAATGGALSPLLLFVTMFGVGAVAASASVFNHIWERKLDRLMPRTAGRPLPTGRLRLMEAYALGIGLGVLGWIVLSEWVNLFTAELALLSWCLYVLVYTPLKKVTVWNTFVGAFPGALPVLIGWVATGRPINLEAIALFMVVFLWQFPHFFSIAWLCKQDYFQAGIKMLPSYDPSHRWTAGMTLFSCLLLFPINGMLVAQGNTGLFFLVTSFLLNCIFLKYSWVFSYQPAEKTARGLLRCSLLYLPLVFMSYVIDCTLITPFFVSGN
ncbi:Protoheme IX farnesyltransferase [Planctomycetales bacterium 10988]|nr:Protoheme IX farnesyltransferase [Planctomycetales bacterium 10988]